MQNGYVIYIHIYIYIYTYIYIHISGLDQVPAPLQQPDAFIELRSNQVNVLTLTPE
jgi:hypothetical protein